MNINYRCLRELEIKGLFETPEHRSRFSELLNCYCNYPFFNKGLCKCMYLSSWDDNGKVLENMSDGYDRYIFQLAGAFLTSQDFQMPYVPIAKEGQHIIQRALEAAEVIETVFNAE